MEESKSPISSTEDDTSQDIVKGTTRPKTLANRNRLEKPWVRVQLIRELAQSMKQVDLAKKYDVTEGAITLFKQRHAERIEEVRNNLNDQLAGLWIAKKEARLEVYQNDLEWIDEVGNPLDNIKDKARILKQVAEELGQLPPRINVAVVQPINYNIEGIDPEQLK